MRLLIVTQKVDRTDPILGFFHRWIEEFAKHCESVIVIGQKVGEHRLPGNVRVLSLGKERGSWRWAQVMRYRLLLFKYRKQYDAILVHMTPIWAVIAWRAVIFLRKPLYVWYEARGKRWPLKIALALATKVFSASVHGMPMETKKSVIVRHGIDTQEFKPGSSDHRDPHLLITVGRISGSKRLHIILDAFAKLPSTMRLLIAGTAITDADHQLLRHLQEGMSQRGIAGRIEQRALPPEEVTAVLQHATLFLHSSQTSLDKALIEAMACECLVVSCSEAAHGVLPPACLATAEGMADRVITLLRMPKTEQDQLRFQLRDTIVRKHSLQRLIRKLVEEMQ